MDLFDLLIVIAIFFLGAWLDDQPPQQPQKAAPHALIQPLVR